MLSIPLNYLVKPIENQSFSSQYILIALFFSILHLTIYTFRRNSIGFKKIDRNLDFADFALESSLETNRSVKQMEKLGATIDWSLVQYVLTSHHTVGSSAEGAKAYPP